MPTFTRDDLVDVFERLSKNIGNVDRDRLTLADYANAAAWLRESKREPSRYAVTWLQHHSQDHPNYDQAAEHAKTLMCSSKNTCVQVKGIYEVK